MLTEEEIESRLEIIRDEYLHHNCISVAEHGDCLEATALIARSFGADNDLHVEQGASTGPWSINAGPPSLTAWPSCYTFV